MRYILATFLSFTLLCVTAQDHLYSIKSGNLNHYNPALVGTQSDVSAIFTQRGFRPYFDDQGHYSNRSILANYNFKNKWGVGLSHTKDNRSSTFVGNYCALFRTSKTVCNRI